MADPKPDQEPEGLRFNGRRIPLISWLLSFPTKKPEQMTPVDWIAAGAIGAVIAGIVLAQILGSGSSNGSTAEQEVAQGSAPASPGNSEPGPGTSTVVEWADNREGSPVFADPTGAPVKGKSGRIPYGTEVVVSCFAPNESGMASVSGFYRIASGEWQGDYVVADTMTNGGEVGDTDTPNVDEEVPSCSSGKG